MKAVKIVELREKTAKELRTMSEKFSKDIALARMQLSMGKLKDTSMLHTLKKNRARIASVVMEKEN